MRTSGSAIAAMTGLAIVAVLLSLGCRSETEVTPPGGGMSLESQSDSEVGTNAEAPSPKAGERSATEVELVVADEKQFQRVVDGHRGKVVLVDFWATWCQSCVQHFPETVELFNAHSGEGLAAVTVNFDALDNGPAVEQFLKKVRAGALDNLQSKYDGVGTEVPVAFDFEGILPHYRLYDRTGKLRYRWDEPPADLQEKLDELLAEKPAG